MTARALSLLFAALTLGACNSSPAEPGPSKGEGTPQVDASAPPTTGLDGGGLPDAQLTSQGCFANPTTYLEIINACTDAQAVDKQVDLSPMNLADGGLQPLP
jgi:hypothetical protein